jgi:hypothetical protein
MNTKWKVSIKIETIRAQESIISYASLDRPLHQAEHCPSLVVHESMEAAHHISNHTSEYLTLDYFIARLQKIAVFNMQ